MRSLLGASELPSRAAVEHTLTDGYAYALGLERERLRIERRLRQLVAAPGNAAGDAVAEESVELLRLLAEAEQELASVRALLSSLRAQAL